MEYFIAEKDKMTLPFDKEYLLLTTNSSLAGLTLHKLQKNMTKRRQIYRCTHCGNTVEVLHQAHGILSCDEHPMELLTEQEHELLAEKHIPVIEKISGGYKVHVGKLEHPMLPAHFIEWIELNTEERTMRKYLTPGDQPVAEFATKASNVSARAYCNIHGLWKSN